MNIFLLSWIPKLAAIQHLDKHVRKMILESIQLLTLAWALTDPKSTDIYVAEKKIYKPALHHQSHPCTHWVSESRDNYIWLSQLALALCEEYTYRFEKVHASCPIAQFMHDHIPPLPTKGLTPPALAMADNFKKNKLLQPGNLFSWSADEKVYWETMINEKDEILFSYKYYYLRSKLHLINYTKREMPNWIKPFESLIASEKNLRKTKNSLYYYHQPDIRLISWIQQLGLCCKKPDNYGHVIWLWHLAISFKFKDIKSLCQRYSLPNKRSKVETIYVLLSNPVWYIKVNFDDTDLQNVLSHLYHLMLD